MNKEFNIKSIREFMGENLSADNLNVEIIQSDEFIHVSELKIGLISGFSTWSENTLEIGKRVINELSAEMAKNEIPIYLIDCDFVSIELQKLLFKTSSLGNFESCWIENGEILKRFKDKHELDPFLFFVKNRLREINEYFENNIIKSYILNPIKKDLGIDSENFISREEAIILSKSKYKNQFLYELMEYQEKGHYYLYEDDRLTIYEETRPTHLSSCFLRIKDGKIIEGST